jgi:acetolactate synthase-1/2/3 large subunit
VALVTSGPGVTNAVTGLSTAYMDSIPMVVISGQVPTHAIGQDAFQECDTVGITRPVVKHNFLVKDVRDLAETIKKAFYIARTGRPGPVLVDIPKDISMQKALYAYPKEIEMRSYKPVDKGHAGQIRKAVQLLLHGRAPDDLHRRRRDPGQCLERTEQAGRQARLPGHQHADGPGRLPRLERPLRRHAGHARHL